jgi:hypothetical protein
MLQGIFMLVARCEFSHCTAACSCFIFHGVVPLMHNTGYSPEVNSESEIWFWTYLVNWPPQGVSGVSTCPTFGRWPWRSSSTTWCGPLYGSFRPRVCRGYAAP